jgi:aminoglycoside phosphotransferase (APT) family kinase protein
MPALLPDDIIEWIETACAATVSAAARLAGGGRNEAWTNEVQGADGVISSVFLRWDRSDPVMTGDPWTLRREAEVYRALSQTTLPVARFIAVHPTREAMLLTVVEGDGRFSRITDPGQQTAVAKDFIGHLAALHAVDVHAIGLADEGDVDVREMVLRQLDEMESLVAFRGGVPEALLGLALAWLRANVPGYAGPAVLVQGDTGPGNFMYDCGRITAIVDWELAHLGDPMDDLAWVSLRAVQEPFSDLEERFAEYEALSGCLVDLDRIRYYRVLAGAKIMVMGHGSGTEPADAAVVADGADRDPGARLIFGHLHRRLLAEAMAEVMHIELEPPPPAPVLEPADWSGLYDVVLAQLRSVVAPRITDGFALQRTKGLARVIKYLQATDRLGDVYASAELEDIHAATGTRPATVREGRHALACAVRDESLAPQSALTVIHRRVCRDNELLAEASGALAKRHYDQLLRFSGGRGHSERGERPK